ncbi:MAG TPA: glycerol kinase GlpK [Ktedonobacterales bacterium]
MAQFVLALDQGTTSSRAILFTSAGTIAQVAQKEFPQIYPQPGLVEHNPEDIWSTQLQVAQEVLRKAGISADDVAAIGITNQRETTFVWERESGRPIFNAIVWQSRLTVPICDELKAKGFDKEIRARTGLVTDAYFSGTKVKWILDNVPGARERARRGELLFGNADTFLIWRLTKGRVHVTDFSNASRTLLFNIRTLDWDDVILNELNIPRQMLPKVMPSSAVYGETAPEFFGKAIPIAGDAGDQQAATFGQACFEAGQAKNTYGTGCFLLMNTGKTPVESSSGLLTTIAWGEGSPASPAITYALEGSVFIAGAAVQWLRDGLGIIKTSSEVESLAASVPNNGGVYFVPAFVGLGAPYWDSSARGTILGLTRGATAGHLARATLESMCYQTRDVAEAMMRDSKEPLRRLRVDGGASLNNLLMQFQADILGVPVERPKVAETTALGAAYLAGLASGFWHDKQELVGLWGVDRVFEPQIGREQREDLYASWKRAVEHARGWETPQAQRREALSV